MTYKEKQRIEEIQECPECKSTRIIKDNYRGELLCDNCGLVVEEELIDYGPDWRAFDNEQREKKSHIGAPLTQMIHDKGLSTEISQQNRDSYGKPLSNKRRSEMHRLRKWQKRIRTSSCIERNMAYAFSLLVKISSKMNLPRAVRETAAMIYRKAVSKDLIRGRTIEGIVAASLYAACRQCHVPRTFEEISKAANIQKREIGRNYRFIARKLKLKLLPTSPQEYIARFGNKLNLNMEIQAKAIDILNQAEKEKLTVGQNPIGIAAASLYIASVLCGNKKTQREVAEEIGVTEVTIRNKYKQLSEKLDIDIAL